MLSKARISAVMMVGASARFGKWKKKNNCDSVYIATFDGDEPLSNDYTGQFKMTIKENGATEYDIKFNLPDGSGIDKFNYHLHSDYNGGNLADTLGHYDPDFKCGGKSSMNRAPTDAQCNPDISDNYACSTTEQDKCERGDLSGKLDVLKVKGGRVKAKNLQDTVNPPLACDFYEPGTKTGAGFNSVVFHDPDASNAKIFGGKLELQEKSKKCLAKTCQKYYGKLDGKGINNGVKGLFIMELCDGAPAEYKLYFRNLWNSQMDDAFLEDTKNNNTQADLVVSKQKGFNWHLHSAADETVLGGAGTGGHYDPFFKCGTASSWKNTVNFNNEILCEADYPTNDYELGDLGGRLGLTKEPDAAGKLKQTVEDYDTESPLNCDYDVVGQVDSGAVFSSVVFHDGSGKGTRLFGVNLKRSFPWWR